MIKKIIPAICFLLPSAVSRIMYRLMGHKIGKGVKMPFLSFVYADKIEIGDNVDIRPLVFIVVSTLVIGNKTILSYGTQIKGQKGFYTKDNCFFGAHSLINCEEDIRFGFYSGIGPGCKVYTHGSFLPVTRGYPAKFKDIVVEDFVWIGMAVNLLPGAHIESRCIINTGVTITSRIKEDSFVEVDPNAFRIKNLKPLQRFFKKSNEYYHEHIISDFLGRKELDYEHDKNENVFISKNGIQFKSFPQDNKIEIHYKRSKKITYDLENFYTDHSILKIHEDFLFFLRRRYGLTLRTKY
jgi:acetyltransferase-like isoleucine patch superfamily enzyme